MIKRIIGGVTALAIGGTTYAVSNTSVINNFSKETGMSQQQAQQYVNSIPQSDLDSFSKVGQGLIDDGKDVNSEQASLDCSNYAYQWETSSLTCPTGKGQLGTIGDDEITLGNCYKVLDTQLGSHSSSKINECISDIDMVNADYTLPIATALLDAKTLSDGKNTNIYNKSVLEAALQSN